MSVVRNAPDQIVLTGECPSSDAEALLTALLETPHARVDWRGCDSAHTAVIQVLMASRAVLVGPPRSEFLATYVAPLAALRGG